MQSFLIPRTAHIYNSTHHLPMFRRHCTNAVWVSVLCYAVFPHPTNSPYLQQHTSLAHVQEALHKCCFGKCFVLCSLSSSHEQPISTTAHITCPCSGGTAQMLFW